MVTDKRDYSLKAHNTFGIDARCRRYLEFHDVEEARRVADILRTADGSFLIVGGGSNLLLTQDYDGIVVHPAIKGFEIVDADEADDTLVRVGCGENWDQFVETCVERGLHGAENLSLIPGDVGACAVQNIGAYGVEAKDIISRMNGRTAFSSFMWCSGYMTASSHCWTTATFVPNCSAATSVFQRPHSFGRSLSTSETPNCPTRKCRAMQVVSS